MSSPTSSITATTAGGPSKTTALPTTASIPSSVPTLIVPADSVVNQQDVGTGNDDDPTKDDTLISILLSASEYPWLFVVQSSDATSQLFNEFPVLLSTPLNITTDDVKTYGLMIYQPASWDGQEASLLTQYLAYIPSSQFDTLDSYLQNPHSALFQQSGIPGQLAAQIDTAYPLAATSGPSQDDNSSSSDGGGSSKKRDIIIGVCVGVGGVLWIGLVYWIYNRVKRSNEKALHRRLSEHMSMFGGDQRRFTYGTIGARGRPVSEVPSIAPSEIDDRPSSFYASPIENNRSLRNQQIDEPSHDDPAYTGQIGDGETYGPSVFGTSWFAQPAGGQGSPTRLPPVPQMPTGRNSPGREMTQVQNPFEDIVTQSYLTTSGNRRSHLLPPGGVSKAMISQPTLQANSLEWTDDRHSP